MRANEQLGLLTMHTLWLREHNRLAAGLLRVNGDWDGEKIFQEARRILAAQLQHITYDHWLPRIFGPHYDRLIGPYGGYNASEDASVANAFATAAFRFGHGLINPVLYRYTEELTPVRGGHLPLHQAFFSPERLLAEGGTDPLLRGLFLAPMKAPRTDQMLNKDLTEKLFVKAHHIALDLAALNIQRGRDHALPEYMEWRRWCGLSVTENWEQMEHITNPQLRDKLKKLYGHPANMDLWVAGMSEELLPGAKVGPTFACIIADQFRRTRAGDRLWYENPGLFTPLQLAEIKKRTLGSVICDNGDDIRRITPDVFAYPGKVEPDDLMPCEAIPRLNLNLWQDCACSEGCGAFSRPQNEDTLEAERSGGGHGRRRRAKRSADEDNEDLEFRLEGLEKTIGGLKAEVGRLRQSQGSAERMSRCLVDGVWMEAGAKWAPDLCTSCDCRRGQVWCRQKSCPLLRCEPPFVHLPFQCCPVCAA